MNTTQYKTHTCVWLKMEMLNNGLRMEILNIEIKLIVLRELISSKFSEHQKGKVESEVEKMTEQEHFWEGTRACFVPV